MAEHTRFIIKKEAKLPLFLTLTIKYFNVYILRGPRPFQADI